MVLRVFLQRGPTKNLRSSKVEIKVKFYNRKLFSTIPLIIGKMSRIEYEILRDSIDCVIISMTRKQYSRFGRSSFILKQVQTQTALESRFRLGLENLKKRLKDQMRPGFSV